MLPFYITIWKGLFAKTCSCNPYNHPMRRLLSLFIGEETEAQELNNLPVISNLVGALAFEPMWFDLKPVASAFFSALAAEFLPHLPQLAKVLIPQIGVIIT